jgi:hypothetical protein
VDKALYNSATSLMTKIVEVMNFLITDSMAKACRRSKKRMEA